MSEQAAPTTLQKIAAEGLGTFGLVLTGCGTIVAYSAAVGQIAIDPTLVGLAFGLAFAVASFAFGRFSGGYFNPATSLGAALAGRLSWKDAGIYIGVQFGAGLAAIIALLVLALGLESFDAFDSATPLAPNGFSEGPYDYAWWATALLQLLGTMLLVLLLLGIADRRHDQALLAPLAGGLALGAAYFATSVLDGGGLNPARTLGPALFSGSDWILQSWPFLVMPFLGAAAAGLLYPVLFGRDGDAVPGSGLNLGGQKSGGGYGGPGQYDQGQPWQQQGGYAHQGYGGQQQGQQGYGGQQAAQAAPAQQAEQPIIQDGWQWDPQAQQWIPAQQQGGQPGWDGGGDSTQVRPPE